jgi:hypothetical protein
MKNTILFVLIFIGLSATAQLKRKTHSTDFTEDQFYTVQNIKHGQFLRVGKGFLYRHIMIFGNYKQDKRTDDWYFFYRDVYNSIMSRGSFVKDKKVGSWFEYYPLQRADSLNKLSQLLGATARAALFADPATKLTQNLAYDTTGQKLMSSGIFLDDEKIGVWNYYSPDGKLLHQYDHSSKKLLINHAIDSVPTGINFLGGGSRFMSLLFGSFALNEERLYGQKSTVFYKVGVEIDTLKCERVKFTGSAAFANYCDRLLLPLREDWIVVRPQVHTDVYIEMTYVFIERRGRFFSVKFLKDSAN